MFDRRQFFTAGGAMLAGLPALAELHPAWADEPATARTQPSDSQPPDEPTQPAPKRIAIITTVWTYLSHAQHMGDRFLVGYPRNGSWHKPPLKVVSLYVDQRPEGDLSRQRAAQHGFKIYPSIAEALRCGGDKLAVDGVVIIGEHGDYPKDAKGQPVFPRYRFFRDVVKTFETTGQSVPLFQDKHFAMDWAEAQQTYRDAKRLGFPMMAGSSLPVTWRLPDKIGRAHV